jgi:hypothetical protein
MSDALITPETTLQEMFELMQDMEAAILNMVFRDGNDAPMHSVTLTMGPEATAMMIPAVEKVQEEHQAKPNVPPPTIMAQKEKKGRKS